ncbi:MAG: hypothetical protein HFJ80_05450 [Clostridiales bacterium]|nr:hypothetical protein [Clostridiales bacterium]
MKRIIRKKVYDTETASPAATRNHSFFGDPAGYSETLYQTPDGFFFLHGRGGPDSPYAVENIRALSKTKAELWRAQPEN